MSYAPWWLTWHNFWIMGKVFMERWVPRPSFYLQWIQIHKYLIRKSRRTSPLRAFSWFYILGAFDNVLARVNPNWRTANWTSVHKTLSTKLWSPLPGCLHIHIPPFCIVHVETDEEIYATISYPDLMRLWKGLAMRTLVSSPRLLEYYGVLWHPRSNRSRTFVQYLLIPKELRCVALFAFVPPPARLAVG